MDCPHGYPSPLNCITCMEDGNLPPVAKPTPVGDSWPAQYPGRCSICKGGIDVGELIVAMSDGSYAHDHTIERAALDPWSTT